MGEQVIERDGVGLAAVESGSGRPVVLLHGLTATRHYVVMGSTALERSGHRVIAYDARGHGRSAPARDPGAYGYPELTLDLRAVLDALGVERAVLAGASMGAHSLLSFALAEPDRVVIGADDPEIANQIARLYTPIAEHIVRTDVTSSEMIKLASNAFLATKISFINEVANVCEVVGATIDEVSRGMGLDREGYVEGLVGLLVGRPGTVQLHGVGLSLIGASTPRLSIESRRGGRLWKQSFAWGIADGLPLQEPCGPETGTRITFDRSAGSSAFDLVELSRQIDLWREAHPRLKIVVH